MVSSDACSTNCPLTMMPTCVQSRSTISRTCEVRKTVDPRCDEPCEQVANHPRGDGVDSLERLVEEEQIGVGQKRRGQRQLLLHAVRVFERELLLVVLEVQQREQLIDAAADGFARHQMNATDEREVLARGQVVEEGEVFRNDAHLALGLERLAVIEHVAAQHAHLSAGRQQKAGEHLHRCRLARAIGPQKAVKRSALDGECDILDGAEVVKEPRQVVGFDGQGHENHLGRRSRRHTECACYVVLLRKPMIIRPVDARNQQFSRDKRAFARRLISFVWRAMVHLCKISGTLTREMTSN